MRRTSQNPNINQVVQFCRNGDLANVQRALDAGFNVNSIDPVSTDSPLMIACRCGYSELVRLCLNYGAKNDPHPEFGQTALHAAVSEGQYYCAAVLLEIAAASDAAGIISNLSDSNGQTPLHVAATVGDSNLIELLLSCDARISCVDVHGQTSLHLCGGSGNEACLALLLDHCGDDLIECIDINGNTVLHHASYNGHIACVRLLLETAADVMAQNQKGQTPFDLAQLRGHKDIAALLAEYVGHHQSSETGPSRPPPSVTPSKGANPALSLVTPTADRHQQEVFSTPQQGSFLPRPPHTLASPTATSPRFVSTASNLVRNRPALEVSTPDSNGYLTAPNTVDRSRLVSTNAISFEHSEGVQVFTKQQIIIRQNSNSNFMPTTPLAGPLTSNQVQLEFDESPHKTSSPYDALHNQQPHSPPSTPVVSKNLSHQYSSPSPTTYFDKHHSAADPEEEGPDAASYAEPLEVFSALGLLWHAYQTEDGHVYYLDMKDSHSQWEDPREHGLVQLEDFGSSDEQHQHLPPKSPSPKAMEKSKNFGIFDADDKSVVKKIVWDEVVADSKPAAKEEQPERAKPGRLREATFLKVDAKETQKFSLQEEISMQQEKRLPTAREVFEADPVSGLDEERCARYLEEYKAGRSLLELREHMEAQNETDKFILQVFSLADELPTSAISVSNKSRASGDSTPTSSESSSSSSSAVPEKVTLESLAGDPVFGKYVRMSKMGVPPLNVVNKMKMDDVEVSQRNKMMLALGLEPEEAPGAIKAKAPSAAFQTLHWNTLPADRLKNSIWSLNAEGSSQSSAGGTDVAENEMKELEKLFSTNGTRQRDVKTVDKQVIPLKILERKRAQNIAIGLVAFKVFGTHLELMKAICSLNTLDDRITADHLDNFRNLLPTDAEMKRIPDIKGSKHPAELFIQTALLFYPELPRRLTCFAVCLNFAESCASVIANLKMLINCCNQVLSSSRLAKLLKKMLAVGNVMNQGTSKGQAAGFTLDSLLKMVNTKGTDNKTSLLDYVVKSLYDKGEQSVLAVVEDLSLIDRSAKLSDADIGRDVDGILKNHAFIQDEFQRNQKNMASNVLSSPTAKMIVSEFDLALQRYMTSFQRSVEELTKWLEVMRRKVGEIVVYFGEEAGKCDTTKIFTVLQEFRTALLFSKESTEWKIRRASSAEA